MRPLQIVEDQNKRRAPLAASVSRKLLMTVDASRESDGVPLDGTDKRRVLERQIEQLPEEVRYVPYFSVLEDGRQLRANVRLRGVALHPLDDAETRPQYPSEHFVRGSPLAGRTAIDARNDPNPRTHGR